MNLTKELQRITQATERRIDRENARYEKLDQRARDIDTAGKIMKDLPKKLRTAARLSTINRYEVLITKDQYMPSLGRFNTRTLTGVARLVFRACKQMGLEVYVNYRGGNSSEKNRDLSASLWVCW